jgi:hypothetical protein
MDHPQTQRMKFIRRMHAKGKWEEKKSKGVCIPTMVANFVMGLISKCGHKQISLDPPRSRTKQNRI